MTSKLKTLVLATIAMLAMSAMLASVAQAQFTFNGAPTTVTATGELGGEALLVEGTSVECASHAEGTGGETSVWEITVHVTYTSCKAFGFASATVNMNGCDFIFGSTGLVHISCPAGKAITIVAGNCELQIGSQSNLSFVRLTNHHPHIDYELNLGGITANKTRDGFLCPFNGTGHTSASLSSKPRHLVPKSGGTTLSVH